MAKISIPEMKSRGYSDILAIGTVCASGTFAIMFPPSVPLIIYGVITGTSIKDLFLAGIIPGLLTLVGYVIVIIAWVLYSPSNINQETGNYSWTERVVGLKPVWPALLIVAFALGSLYAGIVTPSEAGAMGAFGAFLVGIVFADLEYSGIRSAHSSAVELTGMIFIILIGAEVFGRYLTLTGAINNFVTSISELPISPLYILLLAFIAYIALGAIMDQLAILIITLPVTFPLVTGLGYDGVWFGIAIVKTVEIGLITPPFGMNVFAATSAVDIDTSTGFKGSLRFLVVDIVVIALLIAFPDIALWLPSQI
jgi:tripartite ATP-independent transporter DctM subunit